MGREIRRVPESWMHPVDGDGIKVPLHDRSFAEADAKYRAESDAWSQGWHNLVPYADAADLDKYTYEEWDGPPPERDEYRPEWTEPADCYQVYENVSEGTPISPVIADRAALIVWLTKEGQGMGIGGTRRTLSPEQAEAFAGAGSSLSMVGGGGRGLREGWDT